MATFRPRRTRQAKALRNNATDAERKLWLLLRNRQLDGAKFSRQMPVGPYICDFLCREHALVIEVDGDQHNGSTDDRVRDAYLEEQGLKVLRFWNNEVLQSPAGVAAAICAVLPTPNPSRSREGNDA